MKWLMEQMAKFEHKIRAHYHKFLDCSSETLVWMMAVNASFLLEFFQVYLAEEEGKAATLTRVSPRMLPSAAGMRKRAHHNAILRDVVMLENQIPLFVLRKMLELQLSASSELGDDILVNMLIGFCEEVFPFKMVEILLTKVAMRECSHLLDVLYRLITPKCDEYSTMGEGDEGIISLQTNHHHHHHHQTSTSCAKQLVEDARKVFEKINKGPSARFIKRIVVIWVPWKVLLCNLPGLRVVLQAIASPHHEKEGAELEREAREAKNNNNPPLAEEIEIPSVSELCQAGVSFFPIKEGIDSICFDDKKVALYLPSITLDFNTSVLLRNLVAYEAAGKASRVAVLARYTELMNGIIDTEEDARILRERGIILNGLKRDEEVAMLWNGMSRSVRLTKVPFLDKTIEDVNKYYHGCWKVKMGKIMKRYVFGSWRFLTLLAAIMLLLLMTLQAFFSIFACFRLVHFNTNTNTASTL